MDQIRNFEKSAATQWISSLQYSFMREKINISKR